MYLDAEVDQNRGSTPLPRNPDHCLKTATAKRLISINDGRQLFLFNIDQAHSGFHQFTLGKQHFKVFSPSTLEKLSGTLDCGFERFQLLSLRLNASPIILNPGHVVDHFDVRRQELLSRVVF